MIKRGDLSHLPIEVAMAIEHSLGRPVLPVVKMIAAGSSAVGSRQLGTGPRLAAQLIERHAVPEQAPTDRDVVSRLRKPRPPAREWPAPSAWPRTLRAEPLRDRPSRLRRPMPGSIRIVTAPALNRAKTSEMNSMLGGTSSASRVPGRTPKPLQPSGQPVAVVVQLLERDRTVRSHAGRDVA